MKRLNFLLQIMALSAISLIYVSCSDDDDDNQNTETKGKFKAIEAPYLICANRNPGGVGFDFKYDSKSGGANNMDDVSVSDFKEDLIIKTIKTDKDGSANAVNFITLNNGATAVNYSNIDNNCCGITAFNALTYKTVSEKTLSFKFDDQNFSLDNLSSGTSGLPLFSEVQPQVKKLFIGDAWKAPAKNDVEDDEPIWIIKTQEGHLVKFIVNEFPASNAPTANGYVNIQWSLLK
jgi:hypothetical protein